ncbi:glutamate formimidoyltransferase [Fusibacter paucivorans]|uniref:glutamate formimidoyltransferase n=1 Tax=Fusibacter paucivorans TaxID=76009 RepID=A0ABS5PQL4_9FIRM|nr:glutamate formimidoyltransferase [Fusibacter paucivorans]MBS7527358.1 glutamate formimidoyltransferase [Fusibacter paucivorans]
MKQIIECIPNFSEGRDLVKIEEIVSSFRGKKGIKLLDYSNDEDHNRLVVTVVGEPEAMLSALTEAVGKAILLIDLNSHEGQHPRMGAVDVIPFVPIKAISMDDCVELSKRLADTLYEKYQLPSFLYEKSAAAPHRENLATLRKGQFEGMREKVKDLKWQPDYGVTIHPTAGIVAIGARMPLVAFNVNLNTNDVAIADKIAKSVRHISGGLRYCKALGIELKDRQIVQVSMNMTDYTKTPLYRVFELIRIEAQRYGVSIVGSEIIGLVPMAALVDTASYYLGLDEVEVLETRFME